ncbi:MAG: AraC family transcriptional regulator ligand-binding domain-containing protein [Bacteroidota bacterium]
MKEKVISAGVVLNLIHYAMQRGIDVSQFDISALVCQENATSQIPFKKYAGLFEYILSKTKDDKLGLHIGKQYNLAALGVVGQLIQSAADIREAVTKSCETFNLVSNVISIEMREQNDSFSLLFRVEQEAFNTHPTTVNHLLMTSVVFAHLELSYLTFSDEPLIVVSFSRWKKDRDYLEKLFKSKVLFDEQEDYLKYNARLLDRQILWADYALYLQLEQVANEKLAKLVDNESRLAAQVKSVMIRVLNPNLPSIEEVADQLGLSARDMQRKLKYEKTSYQQIKSDIQKELAVSYLLRGLSVKETCYLMGYSAPSAFTTAFHRWYGIPPNRYRKEHLVSKPYRASIGRQKLRPT